LQAFFDKGNKVQNLTSEEKALVTTVVSKIDKARETPEFHNIVALGKEIQNLIESEFARNGGPAGVTDKYGWLKDNKKNQVVAKWYADHPDYSNYGKATSTSGTGTQSGGSTYKPYSSTYKPYTPYAKKAFKVYPGAEWTMFKKWAPAFTKAMQSYFRTGKMTRELAQKIYELWESNKASLSMGTIEEWVFALREQGGVKSV
jgi:hypothetical protein